MKVSYKKIIILIIASVLMSIIPLSAESKVFSISDVSKTDPYYDCIQQALNEGWMSLSGGEYLPDKYVTRAQFAYILTKYNNQINSVKKVAKASFSDVTSKTANYQFIELQKNIIPYFKTKGVLYFKPATFLTREQALVAAVKIKGFEQIYYNNQVENPESVIRDIITDEKSISPGIMKYVGIGLLYDLIDVQKKSGQILLRPKKYITRKELTNLLVNSEVIADMYADFQDMVDDPIPEPDSTPAAATPIPPVLPAENSVRERKMVNIKDGGMVNLSDIYSSVKGMVTKSSEESYLSAEGVAIGSRSLNGLVYGQESWLQFELNYNLVSRDKAKINIGFNSGDKANEFIDYIIWEVPKGNGKLLFNMAVTPKKWIETPFKLSTEMFAIDTNVILGGYRIELLVP